MFILILERASFQLTPIGTLLELSSAKAEAPWVLYHECPRAFRTAPSGILLCCLGRGLAQRHGDALLQLLVSSPCCGMQKRISADIFRWEGKFSIDVCKEETKRRLLCVEKWQKW